MLFYTPPVEWPSHLGPDLVSASRTRASTTQGARTAIERRLRTQSRPPQPRARLACSCHDRAQPLRRRRAPCAPQRRASTVASSRRVYNFSCRPRPARQQPAGTRCQAERAGNVNTMRRRIELELASLDERAPTNVPVVTTLDKTNQPDEEKSRVPDSTKPRGCLYPCLPL